MSHAVVLIIAVVVAWGLFIIGLGFSLSWLLQGLIRAKSPRQI
jgi:hypothetical protein